MFSSVLEKAVNQWEKADIIKAEDRDVYIYGLDLVLFTIINLSAVILTAALFGRLYETIILLSVVIPLQSFGGGYHAETHLRCFLIMFIGWFIVMPITAVITPAIAIITVCVSLAVIFVLAPVPHINVPMGAERRHKMRIISRVLGSIAVLLSFVLLRGGSKYSLTGIALASGIGVIAFSMFCAWLKHRFSKITAKD